MPFPRKAERAFEWNLNTILNVATLIGVVFGGAAVLVGGGAGYQRLLGQIEKHSEWIISHEGEIRERRDQAEANSARFSTSISALDERLDQQEALGVRLSDRVSATEARSQEFAQTLRELQASINEQSGDLKVIRAWIERQEREQ